MTSHIYLCLLLQLCVVFLSTDVSGQAHDEPEWKRVLKEFPKWIGYYTIYQAQYTCTLQVHSVQSGQDGSAMLTFKDRDTVMDVTAFSYDDTTIIIKIESMHKTSKRFPGNVEFKVEGTMKKIQGIWTYSGRITEPRGQGFKTLIVRAQAQAFANAPGTGTKTSSLTLGLGVGIPVTLVVIVSITAVLMIIWGVRKGYIRHVPRSFTTFRNPPECDVRHENGREAVHM